MENILKIAICEDLETDAKRLAELISHCGILCDISIFQNAEALLLAQKDKKFELLFLDIYLKSNGMSGMDLAHKIRECGEECELVFTTSSDSFALYGYEVNALQYLLKPLTKEAVAGAVTRYIEIRNRKELSYCTVVVNRSPCKIYYRDIFYVEANDKYCQIFTKEGMVETYSTISKMNEKLPNPPFLRCHRGYIVNMDYIAHLEESSFIMANGDIVLIPQLKFAKIKKEYMNYLSAKARNL